MSAGTSVGDVKTSLCTQWHVPQVPQVPQIILLSNAKVNVNTDFNNHSNSNTNINTKISPVTVSGIFSKPSRVADLSVRDEVEKENDHTGAISTTTAVNNIDNVVTSQAYPIPIPLLRPFRNRYASTCTNMTSTASTISSSNSITQRILDGISSTSLTTFIIPTGDIDFETVSEREMVTIRSHGSKPYGYDHAEGILRIAKRIMGNENFMELITTTDTLTVRVKSHDRTQRPKPYAFAPYEEDLNNDGITDVNQFVEDVVDFGTSATKDSELQLQHRFKFRFQLPLEVEMGVQVDADTWNTNGTVVRRSAAQKKRMLPSIPCSGDITNTTITMAMTPVPVPAHKHWIVHWHCWVAWWTGTHPQRPRRHHHHRHRHRHRHRHHHRHHRIGTDTDTGIGIGIGPSPTAPHV
jgi:hypothetical protein